MIPSPSPRSKESAPSVLLPADDPDLLAAYSDQVPVIFVDGHLHDFWRVDAGRLGKALDRHR